MTSNRPSWPQGDRPWPEDSWHWGPEEWADWRRLGRPRVAPTNDTLRPRLDGLPIVAPQHTIPPGFTLYPSERSARVARDRAIDNLLEMLLGRRS